LRESFMLVRSLPKLMKFVGCAHVHYGSTWLGKKSVTGCLRVELLCVCVCACVRACIGACVRVKCITVELLKGCNVQSVALIMVKWQSGIEVVWGNARRFEYNKFIVSQRSDPVINKVVENWYLTAPCNW
jgi:hypothetical protein